MRLLKCGDPRIVKKGQKASSQFSFLGEGIILLSRGDEGMREDMPNPPAGTEG